MSLRPIRRDAAAGDPALAALVAGVVAALSLAGMALQDRLVAAELRNGTVAALAASHRGIAVLALAMRAAAAVVGWSRARRVGR
jgi:hypothetical protein